MVFFVFIYIYICVRAHVSVLLLYVGDVCNQSTNQLPLSGIIHPSCSNRLPCYHEFEQIFGSDLNMSQRDDDIWENQ